MTAVVYFYSNMPDAPEQPGHLSPDPAAPAGDRRVTLRHVASALDVSVATVSLALAGSPKIPPATAARVRQAAQALGYERSDAVSRAMSVARTRGRRSYRDTIACISGGLPLAGLEARYGRGDTRSTDAPDGYNQMLAFSDGLATRAAEVGLGIDHFSLAEHPPEEIAGFLDARGITAAILFTLPLETPQLYRTIDALAHLNLVFLGPCNLPRLPGDAVGCDLFAAGRTAFFEAWRAGYRHLALIPPPASIDPQRRFEAGLLIAAERFKGKLPVETFDIHGDDDAAICRSIELLDAECCVIDCGNSLITQRAFRGKKCGESGPGLVGWHVNVHWLAPGEPSMAGIDQRDREQAIRAVDRALAVSGRRSICRPGEGIEILLDPAWKPGDSLPAHPSRHLNLLPDTPFDDYRSSRAKPLPLPIHATVPFHPDAEWLRVMPLPCVPSGRWEFHGIPFRLRGARRGSPPEILVMHSTTVGESNGVALPSAVSIPVLSHVRAVYFLVGCGYARTGGEVGRLQFQFASKRSVCLPLVVAGERRGVLDTPGDMPGGMGEAAPNLQDWHPRFHPLSTPNSMPVCLLDADLHVGRVGYLYVLRWQNPHPRCKLLRVTIESDPSAESMLVLCGLTVEGL